MNRRKDRFGASLEHAAKPGAMQSWNRTRRQKKSEFRRTEARKNFEGQSPIDVFLVISDFGFFGIRRAFGDSALGVRPEPSFDAKSSDANRIRGCLRGVSSNVSHRETGARSVQHRDADPLGVWGVFRCQPEGRRLEPEGAYGWLPVGLVPVGPH